MSNLLSGARLRERFLALDAFLLETQAFWRPKPFTDLRLPWEKRFPELSLWLRRRSLADADAAHNHPECLAAPDPFPSLAEHAARLGALDKFPEQMAAELPSRFNVDIPGRKWEQIQAFASRLSFQRPTGHWLDWCSGKGHLGRLLAARSGAALTCLEYDGALVEAGQALSDRLGLVATHHRQDVLADDAADRLHAAHTPVALHACGDLHIRLMQLASAAGCDQLAIAPCCYNRIGASDYQPLSAEGKGSSLVLSQDDLRLPLAETVTAGARVRRQRDASMARRLAFDLLQRELRGCDDYLPVPSLPPAWLDKPFVDYCLDLAELKGLPSPANRDWQRLEDAGWQRLAEVRNLELLRGLFRRPMELWLLLDRALYLQNQGYDVTLGTFCSHRLTPRNALLLAERRLPTEAVDNSVDSF